MKRPSCFMFYLFLFQFSSLTAHCWGFFAHKKLNHIAVFLLPPEMLSFYKPNIAFITEHAVDPDKRRYMRADEGPRHYIDIDHYGKYPFASLPRKWKDAVAKFSEDSLKAYGIVPWNILGKLQQLTVAFKERNYVKILTTSADIGHYIADAHVPLHVNSNHNGQLTNQKGIHAFWESRIPEMLADSDFDFFIGKAAYIKEPGDFIWARILESAKASDTVLTFEKELSKQFASDRKYAFESRNGLIIKQYSAAYTLAYNNKMNGMVERRMRQSIFAIASFWYTAWVNAGQPDLELLARQKRSAEEQKQLEELNNSWTKQSVMIGRQEE